MTKIRQILFAVFVVFLFVEIVFVFPAQLENNSTPPAKIDVAPSKPNTSDKTATEQKMEGVHLVESKSGSRDWELFSENAESTKSDGSWILGNVKVLFYNAEKVDYTVTGKVGNIEAHSKNMKITGDVVTQSANGYTFYSNSVFYDAAKRIITSPESIKMVGPPDEKTKGLVLEGGSMETFVEQSLMKIHGNVKAEKLLADGKQFVIKSKQAEFSGKNRMASFIGDVSIDVGTLKLEGPEANFEYRPGVNLLQSVTVKGGVKVSDLDKIATSDSVKFDPEQNKFTFNGRPRVVQNNDEITGDQIIFIDGGKKVKVEKVKAKADK
jgi:LPS export ABC transporter protein LptC/lipopolysaccharide transport protein LptA